MTLQFSAGLSARRRSCVLVSRLQTELKKKNRWGQETAEMEGGILKDIRVDTWTNERREMKRVMRHVEIMMKGVAEAEM